jgi:hypothetical protein
MGIDAPSDVGAASASAFVGKARDICSEALNFKVAA